MLVLTIWPLFALICLGYLLSRRNWPDAAFWPAAERLNYFILFPALLVSSLADAPLRDPAILRMGGAGLVTISLAALAMWAVRRFVVPARPARFGPALQGVIRFNTYVGLAVTAGLTGTAGLGQAAVYLAIAVPFVNVLSIMALSESTGLTAVPRMARSILANPLILACLAGIALSLTGIGLPWGTDRFLDLMGRASLPLGLLCVGAALRPAALRQDLAPLAVIGALRLVAMPFAAALIARAAGLSGTEALVLVVFSAIPVAPTAYVLTRQLGGDGTLMAGLVTSQTLAAVVTIPFVLRLLGQG
ncbi:AEC family transporter [Vannielia litorea]|uniref:AEC family transporter n=1 Tax=Vannielia litorea TaxID=1217970 RepID=UPI001C941125|nr:AEC family transporter [Vannielia litorea]MBY6049743.1 AEC family transporter [Vannielia litorea]MBY6077157.1 AEC family transporter [Vannielia litorea]